MCAQVPRGLAGATRRVRTARLLLVPLFANDPLYLGGKIILTLPAKRLFWGHDRYRKDLSVGFVLPAVLRVR